MRTTTLIPTTLVLASTCMVLACADDTREATTLDSFGSTGTSDSTEGGNDGGTSDGGSGNDDSAAPGDGDGDGDGDPAGDGDGDDDPETGDNQSIPCDIPEAELVVLVPHLVLVLDKSGSMIQNTWDHDAHPQTPEVTRWKSLHNVVSSILAGFDGQFEFGAQLFPSAAATNDYNIHACPVDSPPEVEVAPNNAVGVLLGIPTSNSLNIRGGTPTASGMTSAIDHLLEIDDGDPAAIVLVTDGAANCQDGANELDLFETYDPNLLGIVADAHDNLQIPTYVVGIDISNEVTPMTGENGYQPDGEPDGINPFEKLNELAVAGGRPLGDVADFYQTQNEIELLEALQAIVDDAISCTLLLDPVPLFPELMAVVMDGETVPRVDDCGSEDGWVFTNPDGPYDSLQLCGSYCGQVGKVSEVKAEYYCHPG